MIDRNKLNELRKTKTNLRLRYIAISVIGIGIDGML